METLWQDVRYGFRMLMKNRGVTLIAIVTLALGIGANTAIFTLTQAVLLRPLPYADPERLVMVWEEASFVGFPRNTPAPANYADWKARNQSFTEMAAMSERSFNLTGDGEPERVATMEVTHNFFPLLGVQPPLGRTFSADEDRPGGPRVVVMSHRLWQGRYGGERSVLGREILLNGEKYTVIGVMPPQFAFLERHINLWVPIAFTPRQLAQRGSHYLTVVARMKPGVRLEQARSEMQTIMSAIAKEHPNETGGSRLGVRVFPLHEELTADARRPILMLLVAVGLVLLIACANIGSLLLSRANARRKELSVRAALGARRGQLVRQLLVEYGLLSMAGGGAGLLLAWWSFDFLAQMIPPGIAPSASLQVDAGVLGFTLLVSLIAAMLFGVAPALGASRVELVDALKEGDQRSGIGARGNRLRNAMVAAELALALMLLVGAGLMVQSVFQMREQFAALRPEKLLTLRTVLPERKYADQAQRTAFYDQVLERVRALPGVTAAAYTTSVPLDWKGGTSGFYPENAQILRGLSYDANHRQVSANYLKTMGIALRHGRYLEDRDGPDSPPVAAVNETMAREYWPSQDPIGKRFKLGDPDEDLPWVAIVGVVADVRQNGLDIPVKAEMYLPYRQPQQQEWYQPRELIVRTSVEPMSLAGAIQQEVHQVDALQPVSNIRTMEEILGEETAARRLGMTLLTTFSLLALLLAVIGTYGVLAYFVSQHTREIGVRVALGARPMDIISLVVGKGMSLVGVGVAAGILGAFALTRLMQSILCGVSARDPLTFAAIPILLCVVALLACWIPARRAARVQPMAALRYE
jgi:putative ABC transport system permease protein